MRKKSTLMAVLSFSLLSLTFMGCQNEESLDKPQTNKNLSTTSGSSIKSSCGETYMVFSSKSELYQYLEEKEMLTNSELGILEKSQGFKSLAVAFSEIGRDELLVAEYDTVDNGGPILHGSVYNQYINSIHTVTHVDEKNNDTTNYILPNIFDLSLARAVNVNGIVEIAGQLHKYYTNEVKIILDGDCNKLSMLDNITETDSSIGIVVLQEGEAEFQSIGRINSRSTWDIGNVANGSRNSRLIVYSKFFSGTVRTGQSSSPNARAYYGRARLVPLRRRIRGSWYDSYEANLTWWTNYSGNTVNGIWHNFVGFPNLSNSSNIILYSNPIWDTRYYDAIDVPFLVGRNGLTNLGDALVLSNSSPIPSFNSHTLLGRMQRDGRDCTSNISF